MFPILLGTITGYTSVGLSVGFSILMISPSDIPGNRKHHIGGILMATFLAILSSVCVNLAYPNTIVLLIVIALLVFGNSYISLYGFRASMVAISGLFGITMTLAHPHQGWEIFYNSLYILIGGLWFLLLVYLHLWIKPRQYSEQLLGKCIELIAEFFEIRAQLLLSEDRTQGIEKLLTLQTQINTQFEDLRGVLLDNRSKSGKTAYLQRQFLIFIELVDIFELALANAVPYERLEITFQKNKKLLSPYADFLTELADELKHISFYIGKRKYVKSDINLKQQLEKLHSELHQLRNENKWETTSEELITLSNFIDYFEKQVGKVENIRYIFTDYYKNPSYRDEKKYRAFVSTQNYSLKRLRYHFTFKSAIFRHSLRLTITSIIGFLIGDYFNINNAYWILLTIFITMRPTYGLTKERSQKRIKGTLVGVVIAGIIVFALPYTDFYMFVLLVCTPLAFSLIQKNYTTGAIFITISVIMLYSLSTPDPLAAVKYRLLDTAIGVALAIIANQTIFPYWERKTYDETIANSIKANMAYIRAVQQMFDYDKKELDTAYKVARKEAFLASANLNSAFQRMMQEPKSKQLEKMKAYQITVIQQAFISSVATLGVSIHLTKNKQWESTFDQAVEYIVTNLQECLDLLTPQSESNIPTENLSRQPFRKMESEIRKMQQYPMAENKEIRHQQQKIFKELHLYSQQLHYLSSLAESLKELLE